MLAILLGVLVGIITIIFIGPVLFTLINITLQNGRKAGISAATGIFVADFLYVLLCIYSINFLVASEDTKFYLGIGGIFILAGLGGKYLFFPNLDTNHEKKLSFIGYGTSFLKGFAITSINPFVCIVWINIVSYGREKFDNNLDLHLFLLSLLVTILITDVLKVLLAKKLHKLIQPKKLKIIFRIVGLILIGFSIRLILYIL